MIVLKATRLTFVSIWIPSIKRPAKRIRAVTLPAFEHPIRATTLGDLLLHAAHENPQADAIVFPDGRQSYAELAERAYQRARGLQALVCGGKIRALLAGRYAVAFKDLEQAAYPALRHRIIRSFEAQADRVTTDDIIEHLLQTVERDLIDN